VEPDQSWLKTLSWLPRGRVLPKSSLLQSCGQSQVEPPTWEVVSTYPLLPADVHRLHPGGCKPLPAALHLLTRTHPPVHQQEDWGDAPPHLCHCRQLLLQHETQQPGPVLYHQVGGPAPVWELQLHNPANPSRDFSTVRKAMSESSSGARLCTPFCVIM
jgi:hypothetical protein